jgi:hypothetical protein
VGCGSISDLTGERIKEKWPWQLHRILAMTSVASNPTASIYSAAKEEAVSGMDCCSSSQFK